MKSVPLALSLLLMLPSAQAAEPPRKQLAAERAAIEARFAAESRECATRFVVNACMDEARERRSAALKPVVAREQALAAEERRERARAQAERVQQRQQEAATAEARALSVPLRASEPKPVKVIAKPRAVPDAAARAAKSQAREEVAEAEAERNRKKLAAREAKARERQLEAQRNAGKLKPKGAAKLPTPSAAEIAALGASAASR